MRNLLPGKALPDRQADGDGWVEMTTGDRSTGDDSESNTERESKTDVEDGAENRNAKFLACRGGDGEREGRYCSNSREDVKEDTWEISKGLFEES